MAEITAKDECIKICEAIWSCKNNEQKDGCYKMLETYTKKHGNENIGITFIQIELARLEKTIILMEKRKEQMAEMQKKAQDHNEQTQVQLRQKELEKQVNKNVSTFNKKNKDKIIPLNTKDNKKK